MVKKYIHITLNKPFLLDIYDLYFSPINNNVEYSYRNYEYILILNEKKYIFNGSFRDNYFLITLDIYDIIIDNSIYHKDIILINLIWELDSNNINSIKINLNEKINLNYIVIPLRKELNKNHTFSIDELLNIKEYNKYNCKIRYSNNINKSFNYIYKLLF